MTMTTYEERLVARCRGFGAWFCKLLVILLGRRKGGDDCVYIPEQVINRPDPCLYSQFLLMQLGLPVTWDNPDVALFLNGVEQYTYDLVVDTEYDVVVTVHNSSRRKPALGTGVDIAWIEFGAGSQIRHPIVTLPANVPIWPGTTNVTTKWRTPASPGHYCIEVQLSHPDDGNPSNNRGWNNTQVKQAASQVQNPIRIWNRWPDGCPTIAEGGDEVVWPRVLVGYGLFGLMAGPWLARVLLPQVGFGEDLASIGIGWLWGAAVGFVAETIRASIGGRRSRREGRARPGRQACNVVELTVDSYRFKDATGKDADPHGMFAPRPPAWPARLDPATFAFGPGEAYRDVLLIVDAPDGPGPAEVFNVNARQDGMATGGVSVIINRKQA
jgi:hypothetical protein